MARWALSNAQQDEEESSSSSEEEESEDEEEANAHTNAEVEDQEAEQPGPSGADAETDAPAAKGKIKMSLSKTGQTCHVCGKKGHNAGFIGSVYMDCPNRPCFLCKIPGHTTNSCPYRFAPDQAAPPSNAVGMLASVRGREQTGRVEPVVQWQRDWQVDAAVLRLHSRRCTCLEFHPTQDKLVLSGDKKGQVAIWDWSKVYERHVYKPHKALTNNIRFLPGGDGMSCCTSSSDGILKTFDCETGMDIEMLNLNPEGWIPGESNEKTWGMLYGLAVCDSRNLVIAGDTHGYLHFVDPRTSRRLCQHLVHKRSKINTIDCNPADANLVVTASNDWTARLFDLRCLPSSDTHALPSARGKGKEVEPGQAFELMQWPHGRLVNAAYFSPLTGRKLLTTCADNRLRVWDTWLGGSDEPTRSVVHSHDFNRYLSPFRAEWDPKDPHERLVMIGRYISEDYGGLALHPIDLMDMGSGQQLAALTDPNLTTITPVNKPHPRLDLIISGSSRSLYAWRPTRETEAEEMSVRKANGGGSSLPVGSADFVCFNHEDEADVNDSDDEGTGKKKKRAAGNAKTSANAKTLTKTNTKQPPAKKKKK
ncbi:hypothetical protein WJX73_005316 [Symbiochloris irregularis]|uniref:DNA damage-binding protein 2 n=1 Tax=Symbiochloris irregularis TaxID=706552 RepID=A0AAW1PQJ4_9CHLO